MARSDSFFIRATIPTNGTTFTQTSIDLGAFVDALGKTVMRIHNVSVSYGSPLNGISTVPIAANGVSAFQLTVVTETLDIAPQYWDGGYLVAVESIFLGVDQATADLVDEVTVVLECTVETMTAAASMALALSQQ